MLPFIPRRHRPKADREEEEARGPRLGPLSYLLGLGDARRADDVFYKPALIPGRPLPHQILNTVQGGRIEIGAPTGRWMMVVVYRGKHCPVSKNYLISLQAQIPELDSLNVEAVAVSGDARERAEAFMEQLKAASSGKDVGFKLAYGLPLEAMVRWGLYISAPRSSRECSHPFPEPALFVLNPDGELHIVDYSNSPFARPDLRIMVEGIRYIQENDYPVRGTYGYY